MKLKRIMAMVLCFAMVLSTMSFNVFAEEGVTETTDTVVAKVGNAEFTDIQEAIKEAAPNGTVDIVDDIVVDEWVMIAEGLTTSDESIITLAIDGMTINGGNHTLTIKEIVSPEREDYLFYDAANLTVKDLTIECNGTDEYDGGIGLTSGKISNVKFIGGKYAVLPGAGGVTIEGCNFIDTTGYAIYFEDARPGIVVNGNTFNTASGAYSITMRDDEQFTGNTIVNGRVNLANSAKSIVTGNDFGNERFKVYNDATATIENNVINVLTFNDESTVNSTFGTNELSAEAASMIESAVFPEDDTTGEDDSEEDIILIDTAEELAELRDNVNAGTNYYEGKYVKLNADIDLGNINWTPIGSASADHGFMGNFDGNGHTIFNLTIEDPALDGDGYAYAGLFGVTEGTDKDNQNIIKNLTVENVTISTTGHIVAAAIAYPYYTIVENVKVCGNIDITGGDYTAGVLAYTRRCVDASDLFVEGAAGSTIGGGQVVGGIISDIQMNGGLIANYSNFNASGVTISGTKNVGGISGIIASQTLDTCSVKDVTLDCDDARVGTVAGCLGGVSTISDATVENVSGASALIGGTYDDGKSVEAKIGDKYYATLATAISAAESGDTVTLLCDIENVIEIPDGVALDTNGYRFGDSLTGMGTEEDPYLINNIDDLVWFRDDVNAGNTYEGKYVKLITDIDLEGYEEMNVNYLGNNVSASTFRPIGDYSCNKASFKGIFDGGNNTISNLYISGWDINYHWDNYGPAGLFGTVENAIIKNLTVEGFEIQVEGGDVAAIAGHAKGNCTFENITVTDSKIATYNNGCAGITAWSEAGDYTFKDIEITDSVVLAGLWGSFDSSVGGVLAQADEGATYLFEDIDVACRLDIYNDVTAAYKYHLYRMCGMLIGRGAKFMDGNEVDLNASNITCKNVNITIGEWANYTYINTSGNTWKRVEPGYTYGGVDVSQYPDATIDQKPMTSIVGGGQYGYSGTTAEEFAAQGFDETEIKVVDFAKIARSNVAKIGDNYFASIQSAIDAAENGDTVTLLSNVDIANETINTLGGKYNTYYKVTGKSITIDLNGKTISGEYNNDSMLVGVFSTEQNGHLTLTGNGKINITATKTVYSLLVNYDSTSTLTVEDGEYTVDKVSSSLVYSDKGSVEGLYGNTISGVTINGGTFTLGNIDNVNGPWIFNVGGSGDSYVSVNGGTFNFDIAHQKWADEVVVSKNCYVSDNGDGTWTVKDGAQVTLNDTVLSGPYALRMDFGYPTFADAAAVAETDDVITLISDATGEASFDDIRNLTVDLNGYTLNGAILPSKGDITVKNGSIVNENSGVSAIELNEGKLSLENVNISSARHGVRIDGAVESVIDGGKYTLTATSGTRHAVNVSGAANVTIKNGTFVGPKGTTMDSGSAVCVQTGANVTIEGGNFSGGKNATLGVSGTMSITGGTFDQDPSQYVAVGYAAKANDDGIYSIVSIKPDAYTVEARASKTDVRYNNDNTADSFTVKYVVTGGNVIGAMAQFEYDTTLFKCDEDPNATGRIRMNSNNLSTDADGETVLKELHFTVIKDVEVDTTYTFTPKYVQVVSDYDAAGSGAQDGYVENVVGADVTIIAQYDVTLDTEGAIAGNTYVDKNTDYTGNINDFNENKIYTITYTMGGEEYSIEVEDETFVIENVTGDIVFTGVEFELNFELILVADAVSGYTLVLVKDGVSAGYTYNGEEMFAVERYVGLTEVADESVFEAEDGVSIKDASSVRAILVKGGVTLDEARNAIAVSATASDNLDISYDVNRNGAFYFNDAMTAHGCYKDQYTLYENMAKLNWYLSSDVNTDFVVDTNDYDDTVEAFWATID